MKFFLPIIFLLSISGSVLGKGIRKERSNNEDELSYQELRNLNFSCPWDSCTEDRTDDPPVLEIGDMCSCHSQCWEYGTCCIDSPDRFKPPTHECVKAGGRSYYMVHRCPDTTHPDSIWRSQCEREWDETDDILMISPVTSLNSSRTYKNYYCLRCHETTDDYVSWNLLVTSHSQEALKEASDYSVAYNQTEKTWVAIFDESHAYLPVSLSFRFPDELQAEPETCDVLSNVRADCPGWADEGLHAKCLAYSAVVYTKSRRSYKNVHCALCNGEPLDEVTCDDESSGGGAGGGGSAAGGKPGMTDTFQRCALNCRGKGEDCLKKDRRPESCKGKYDVWNCPAKICTKINCRDSGKVRKNDKCVNP